MKRKKLLVTGVSGLLGNNLIYCLKEKYELLGVYHSFPVTLEGVATKSCDLTDKAAVRELVSAFQPDVIVHCASLTDVDLCESNQGFAKQVNVTSAQNLADIICEQEKVKLIYVSTDLVYAGSDELLTEESQVDPVNYYGFTKHLGEQAARKHSNSVVLRTNIFGWNVQDKFSLAEWMLYKLQNNEVIQGFQDAMFSSLYTFEFAKIVDRIIQKDLKGVYNCGSSSSLSKYEFAKLLAEIFGLNAKNIVPISIDASPHIKAKRAKRLAMNVQKLANALDFPIPTIEESLRAFHADYKNGVPQRIKAMIKASPIYPTKTSLPYGRQWIDEADIAAVTDVLKSSHLTQGPKVAEFEHALATFVGAKHARAVNSGTSALHIACLAAGVGPGDEVITSPVTFVASANCALYTGARPVFADIEPDTFNISPSEIAKKINERTKVIIPVHFAGQSCKMEEIKAIVAVAEKKYGKKIYIIEDASHALGASYRHQQIGSCSHSDMVVASFHPVKHITTGEGGAVFTNDAELAKKLSRFRSHGITNTVGEFENPEHAQCNPDTIPPWYYEQVELGYNYRMPDMQAALGISQLKKMSKFVRRRREIARQYREIFDKVDNVRTPFEAEDVVSSYHLYVLQFDFEKLGFSRAQLMKKLREQNIFTQVHYIPVHTQPYYQKILGTKFGDFPVAEDYYQRCLSIPLFPAMSNEDVEVVAQNILQLIKSR